MSNTATAERPATAKLIGNPADAILIKMERDGGTVSEATIRNIQALLGSSDASMWEQYVQYWGNLMQGNLGISVTRYPAPVVDMGAGRCPLWLRADIDAWAGRRE